MKPVDRDVAGIHTRTIALVTIVALAFVAAPRNDLRAAVLAQDRRIDWDPGVPGGIPNRATICATVNADVSGTTNAQPAIQSAINACPVGQVVLIPAGTYRLNTEITITKAITLRGAGPQSTFLKTYANWHAIQLGDFPAAPSAVNVSGSPAKGTTAITVASAAGLSANDYVTIDQLNDNVEVVNADGTGGTSPEECRSGAGARCLGQIVKVVAVNGTTLTISPALYHNFSAALSPQIWKVTGVTSQAGVEDLSLERVSPTGSEGYHNFKVVACAACWLKNIASVKTETFHVDLDRTIQCEIRDSSFMDGWNFTGGLAYGVVPSGKTSGTLIENNIFYHLRHAMIVKDGAAGNVFGYNYSVGSWQGENWLATDMNSHGAHTTMNLFEGNVGAKIYGDFTHGSASYNTFFRNRVLRDSSAATITNARRAVDIERTNWYYNIIGNVLGQSGQTFDAYEDSGTRVPGAGRYVYTFGYFSDGDDTSDDPQVKATLYRHGNLDYATGSTVWDPGNADHVLPASLYRLSKPAFFGGLAWPPIGPDANPVAGTIPAKERYEGRSVGAAVQPNPPANLTAN